MPKANSAVYDVQITSNTGSVVTGVFKFDGRLKDGQAADFTYVIDPAYVERQKPTFAVTVNRSRNGIESVVRRNMKECSQKYAIQELLQLELDEMLGTSEEHIEEFSVDKERELAAQNVSTQQATTDDLLEIPDFLKRS